MFRIPVIFFVSFSALIGISSAALGAYNFFNFYHCETICNNDTYKAAVPKLCADLAYNVMKPRRYSVLPKADIISMSGCDTTLNVKLLNNNNEEETYGPVHMGLCTLSAELTMCISKGELSRELYWYTYNSATKTCSYDGGFNNFISRSYLT